MFSGMDHGPQNGEDRLNQYPVYHFQLPTVFKNLQVRSLELEVSIAQTA